MLKTIKNEMEARGYSVTALYDPVQTHAVRGEIRDKYEIEEIKRALRAHGATRFRVVKNSFGNVTICFKIAE